MDADERLRRRREQYRRRRDRETPEDELFIQLVGSIVVCTAINTSVIRLAPRCCLHLSSMVRLLQCSWIRQLVISHPMVTLVCKSCQNKLIVPDAVSYHDNLVLELKGPSEVTMTWIGESGLGFGL
ncbi:uncharacterized protein [Dysidea avara]|uniref:uncharacterized protein isoform X2 n=1 Tax=Dysidea avara TaxID=196820 RepID=UPI0033341334